MNQAFFHRGGQVALAGIIVLGIACGKETAAVDAGAASVEAALPAKTPASAVTSVAAPTPAPAPLASSARVLSRPAPEEEAKIREALSALTKPGADVMALLKAMRPSSAEYKAVWVGDAAKKLEDELGKQWDRNQEAAKPPKLDGRHPHDLHRYDRGTSRRRDAPSWGLSLGRAAHAARQAMVGRALRRCGSRACELGAHRGPARRPRTRNRDGCIRADQRQGTLLPQGVPAPSRQDCPSVQPRRVVGLLTSELAPASGHRPTNRRRRACPRSTCPCAESGAARAGRWACRPLPRSIGS
jgi:hypothetical protein